MAQNRVSRPRPGGLTTFLENMLFQPIPYYSAWYETFEKCHFEEHERRLMSFRKSEATEKSKYPSLHSGHGFLPSVEMTKGVEMTKMAVIQSSRYVG